MVAICFFNFSFVLLIISTTAVFCSAIIVDVENVVAKLPHFWESTGFCPLGSRNETHEELLSNDVKFNLALIGSIPNKGIKQVRIHWLLNLILITKSGDYNFTYLDNFMDFLNEQHLRPGFEIMSHFPDYQKMIRNFETIAVNKKKNAVYSFWYDIVQQIANRYKDRYKTNKINKWRFETWNEPDLKMYNVLNFTLIDYLNYVNACVDGLRDSFSYNKPKLGGPAGLFKQIQAHPFCWSVLDFCENSTNSPLEYISFHKKGDGSVKILMNRTLDFIDQIHSKYKKLRQIPIANDEADILTNWSKNQSWRGDTRYAAMIVKVIIEYYKKLYLGRGVKIEVLSNDNAFLNYHPYYFTQRTLLTRFQINNTNPPHVQFIKKPVYSVMGLLSLLGDEYFEEINGTKNSLITLLNTRCCKNEKNQTFVSTIITYVNDTIENQNSIKTIKMVFYNLQNHNARYVVYILDNIHTNPFELWKKAGKPNFPSKELRKILRRVQEPRRIQKAKSIIKSNLTIQVNLTLPSVALIHICQKISKNPGPVTQLKIYNVTKNEVLVMWKDNMVKSKCILTYEVEFKQICEEDGNVQIFKKVNANDGIFLSYQYSAEVSDGDDCEGTVGEYRVRAVDYWDRLGNYSKIINYP